MPKYTLSPWHRQILCDSAIYKVEAETAEEAAFILDAAHGAARDGNEEGSKDPRITAGTPRRPEDQHMVMDLDPNDIEDGYSGVDLIGQEDARRLIGPPDEDDYRNAIRAIMARIDGEFDHPALEVFGPLSINTMTDIMLIAKSVVRD